MGGKKILRVEGRASTKASRIAQDKLRPSPLMCLEQRKWKDPVGGEARR